MKKKQPNFTFLFLVTSIIFFGFFLNVGIMKTLLNISQRFIFYGNTHIMLILILTLIFLPIAAIIIMERGDPGRTSAWLLILFVLPVIGWLLYLTLGSHVIKKRKIRLKRRGQFSWDDSSSETLQVAFSDSIQKRMSLLLLNSCTSQPSFTNQIEILSQGESIFQAMLQAIDQAQHHIHLETYIFRDDQLGNIFFQKLVEKASAGIKVRIIIDGIGSFALKSSRIKALRAQGLDIRIFFPVRFTLWHNKINYRNHRKILVIDGETSFIGGANIGDDYLGNDPAVGNWRDTHLLIRGPGSVSLQRIFLMDWNTLNKVKLDPLDIRYFPNNPGPGQMALQIAASGPDTQWQTVMQAYYYAIAQASTSIQLTSPYFIPNESILTALKTAALAGINIQLLLPQNPDHKLVFWAAMTYLNELIEAGIKIYLYQDGFIHSKVVTVDDTLAIVGTANLDQRSFALNFEVNAIIYEYATILQLKQDFAHDLQKAQLLNIDDFRRQTKTHRIIEATCRLISPIL